MFPDINWSLISLELIATGTLVGLVILDVILPKSTREDWLGTISFVALFGMIGFWLTQRGLTGETFSGMFVMDSLAWFFKAMFLLTMVFVLAMTQQFFTSLGKRHNEFYLLLWLALLGMLFVASSADFLLLFIALEILTISMYVMTAYLKTDKLSIEAGMKYLILGSLSAGFFLYGIALLYGATHSTRFDAIETFVNSHGLTPMTTLALVLIFANVAFKIAAVPFHLWAPDVYQGAPTPVTALLSVGSKAAGFVVLIRLLFSVFTGWQADLSLVLACLAAVSMTYGNLCAMFQTNIKRLFGYSSIAHAGYLLMGAAAGTVLGVSAINLYLLGYLFTNLAAFFVIVLFFTVVKSDEIAAYSGLAQRSKFLAGVLLIALVSLAGLPPMAGFFGKFTLLMATVESGYAWLALIAAANIVVSCYYYLMIVKRVYVDAPSTTAPITVSRPTQLVLGLALLGILAIGIFQGPFLDAALTSAKGIFLAQP